MGTAKIKVWVEATGSRRLSRHFLNANRRLLTVFSGKSRPSLGQHSPPFVRATLTIERKRRTTDG